MFDNLVNSSMDDYNAFSPEDLLALFDSRCLSILDSIAPFRSRTSEAPSELLKPTIFQILSLIMYIGPAFCFMFWILL